MASVKPAASSAAAGSPLGLTNGTTATNCDEAGPADLSASRMATNTEAHSAIAASTTATMATRGAMVDEGSETPAPDGGAATGSITGCDPGRHATSAMRSASAISAADW